MAGEQHDFFDRVRKRSGLTWKELAKRYSIHDRTLRDWYAERFFATAATVHRMSKDWREPTGRVEVLSEYWYIPRAASLGGLKRYQLYGYVGTIDDRRRGGAMSQRRRKENPEKYRLLGCNVAKSFPKLVHSEKLAELVGILLGDGDVTSSQVRISLNRTVDKDYAKYVRQLCYDVSGHEPSLLTYNNVTRVGMCGVELVRRLKEVGVDGGNKVKRQVGVPVWILHRRSYLLACVRGLFDTDGGLFLHRKKEGTYLWWTFGNYSRPLVHAVVLGMRKVGLTPHVVDDRKIYLYSRDAVERYMTLIGSHNPKNWERLRVSRLKWRGARAV